jgi:hypothetical protein
MWVIKCNNCPKCLGVFDSTIKAVEKWEKHNARNSLSTHEYYKSGKYEAIDIIEAYCLNFCLGNVIKYVLRAGKKSPDALPDLKKALSYIEREIKRLEQESEKPSP